MDNKTESKPKVAFYWCASCGGCEEAVVDLDAKILDVVSAIDIIFWPIALDYKFKDVTSMKKDEIAVSFINGAIRTSEQEHVAKMLREKSALVVAVGACAGMGGVPALANLTNKKYIYDCLYHSSPSLESANITEPKLKTQFDGLELELPSFYETVYKLSDVIDVDYYLPGCPPTPELIVNAVTAILTIKLPPKGSILSPDKSLCSSCKLNDTKPEDTVITTIKRVSEVKIDPDKCFLAQGVICMGPATRDGCGLSCINGNMPCTGCFGPTDSIRDQGGKMISALGGILAGENKTESMKLADEIVDPAGTFYRYSFAASLFSRKRMEDK